MRKPAMLHPWFTADQLLSWVKEAPDKTAYQRRLAIWLTYLGDFPAHRVAELLAVSTQAVWKWVGEYNAVGPGGLDRKGRGGRRWGLMSLDEERAVLAQYLAPAEAGDLLTAKQLQAALSKAVGRAVKIDYVYRLLHRHDWRKLPPRPHHSQHDTEQTEAFKKNFRKSSKP
jgi:transposase